MPVHFVTGRMDDCPSPACLWWQYSPGGKGREGWGRGVMGRGCGVLLSLVRNNEEGRRVPFSHCLIKSTLPSPNSLANW